MTYSVHLEKAEFDNIFEPFPIMTESHISPAAWLTLAKRMMELINGQIIIENIRRCFNNT
jgi:hypothetical protein